MPTNIVVNLTDLNVQCWFSVDKHYPKICTHMFGPQCSYVLKRICYFLWGKQSYSDVPWYSISPQLSCSFNVFWNKPWSYVIDFPHWSILYVCLSICKIFVHIPLSSPEVNTLRPETNGQHFAGKNFKCILHEWKLFYWSNWRLFSIGLQNGLAPNRR